MDSKKKRIQGAKAVVSFVLLPGLEFNFKEMVIFCQICCLIMMHVFIDIFSYIQIYIYLEPKRPIFWKLWPIKWKVSPPKKEVIWVPYVYTYGSIIWLPFQHFRSKQTNQTSFLGLQEIREKYERALAAAPELMPWAQGLIGAKVLAIGWGSGALFFPTKKYGWGKFQNVVID